MSAYVVADETINRIIGWLYDTASGGQRHVLCRVDLSALARLGHDLEAAAAEMSPALRDACADLGSALHLLNVGAVRQRYHDADEAGMIPEAYQYTPAQGLAPLAAYKAIRCWRYQCSEGNVPDSALYKAMSAVLDSLAHAIVGEMPEYDLAPWG